MKKVLPISAFLGLILAFISPQSLAEPLVLKNLSPIQARDEIRRLKSTHKFPKEGVVVELKGVYAFTGDDFFELTSTDGGESETARITYRAVGPGVRFIGGKLIPLADFEPVTDPLVLKRLHPDAVGHVLVYDLKKAGIDSLPPLPDLFHAWDGMEFFASGKPRTLARYPNKGWLSFNKEDVVDSGIDLTETAESEYGHPLHGGSFHFGTKEKRMANWDTSTGIWLHGFWCQDWASDSLKIESIDPRSRTIKLAGVHWLGIGPARHTESQPRRYYAYNLLEELDVPGEWYADRDNLKLYYYPLPDEKGKAMLVYHEKPLIRLGSTHHITLDGLSFHFNTGPAVWGNNLEDVVMTNLTVSYTTRKGYEFYFARHCLFTNCRSSQTGETGFYIEGCGDKKKLIPSDVRITGCDFSRPGRYAANASCAGVRGVAFRFDHNYLHDAPYNGLFYAGVDALIESNEVAFVMMESGDGGGFYTGRDWTSQGNLVRWNYLHHFSSAGVKYKRDHKQPLFCEPLLKDDSAGIYLDDCVSGNTCVSNHIVATGRGFLIGGGRDNIIRYNLIEDCTLEAVHLDARGLERLRIGRGGGWDMKEKMDAVDYLNPPWSTRFPWMADYLTNEPLMPVRTDISHNKAVRCKQFLSSPCAARPGFADSMGLVHDNDSK